VLYNFRRLFVMGRKCCILYVTEIIRIRIQRGWYQIVATGYDGGFRLNTWMIPQTYHVKCHGLSTWRHSVTWTKFRERRCTYEQNTEAPSRNHYCHWKAISITYSECFFVALGIQRAKRMRHIIIWGLCGSNHIFSHYLINGKIV
jgi:hypothetical protein